MLFQPWLVGLLVVGGSLGNLLPGDLGRGTHHQLPHPGGAHHHGEHSEVHHNEHHHHQEQSPAHHSHHTEHLEEKKEREGRQDIGSVGVGQVIDFSGAVDDPSTGLKCVVEEVAVETFDKEQLLTCTHSMIQVCDIFLGCFLSFHPLPPGLPLHVRDPVPPPPGGGVL